MSRKYVLSASLLIVLTTFAVSPVMASSARGTQNATNAWFNSSTSRNRPARVNLVNRILNRNVMGTVSALSGNTVTLTDKNHVVYTIDVTNAKIMKSGATISLSGVQVGDTLIVSGTILGTNVVAKNIVDGIPQMKFDDGNVAVRTISSVSGSSFVVQSKAQKWKTLGTTTAITVNTDSNTTFKKDGQTATLSDVVSGQMVTVKGTKDATTGVVTAKSVNIITKMHGKKMGMNKGNVAAGTVNSVGSASFVIQAKVKTGQMPALITINTGSNTVFKKNGKSVSISDLANGQMVMVKGTRDATSGVVTATRVNVVTKMLDKTRKSFKGK